MSLIDDIEAVMRFTEFGVVMMLFLICLDRCEPRNQNRQNPIFRAGLKGFFHAWV